VAKMTKIMNLKKDASHLAEQLFKDDTQKRISFTDRLLEICGKVQDKEISLFPDVSQYCYSTAFSTEILYQ